MILIVDEEVQGCRKEFSKLDDLKVAIIESLDENTETVTIKKRVADNNSRNAETKCAL